MNIFVSNLGFKVDSENLKALFAPYGDISSVKVVMDHETGRSRGFGFVEMPDDAAGNEAISGLNGRQIEGRPLTVNVARPKQKSGKDRFF